MDNISERQKDILFLEEQINKALGEQSKVASDFETYKQSSILEIKELAISAGIWEDMQRIEKNTELKKEGDQELINKLANEIDRLRGIKSFLEFRKSEEERLAELANSALNSNKKL